MTTSDRPEDAPLLLQGMRVLSFCHYLQGPASTQYLADMGADVITVEPPTGAFERHWAGADTFVNGVSAFFVSANRNKRSIAVDLKHPHSKQVTRRLIERADVIVENYRPGVMDRLGLGFDEARRIRRDVIYASATAYGADGPVSHRPGQDLLMQARTGLIATSGMVPTAIGCAAVDQHGAALLAMGIAAAYARKLSTGQGTRIEASLFNAGIDLQTEALTLYHSAPRNRGALSRQENLATWYHPAPYGVYELADEFVAVSLNPVDRVLEALGRDALRPLLELDSYRDRGEIAAALAEELEQWTFKDLAAAFDDAGVWYERVQDYDDLLSDPQATHNRVFEAVQVREGKATMVNHPLRYDGGKPRLRFKPPEIGQHSEEILISHGFSDDEIEMFYSEGVVVGGPARPGETKS
jgi:crotonobetainyl-CoA:carnitine CoA-transferase CaiB-like acyl-CoA transferase